ncbi:LruC domain-containing protein [Shewanella surugensis]|uniref:LruC domain-containing protein n=1 Tax=Shewanella surugensis TaxID=212020 RepID=A0ABT0LBV7_9GAMM|nr:LruC domain-containing protein [Shewanella surugensis]MCL1125167.1 LruC domain-containing protein [Shewanella surugensis]
MLSLRHISFTFIIGIIFSFSAHGAPFEECPTKAFIIQKPSSIPKMFGVDLGTGSYTTLSSDMGSGAAFNGVGFSKHDSYIYGWDYSSGTLGKVGDDYQVVALDISKDGPSASAGNFYVGDVALHANVWYGYRKNKGLFKIPLDGDEPYEMTLVAGSQSNANYNITDFAFHPHNGYLYTVTNGSTAKLLKIDRTSGAAENLGTLLTTEGSFTFGAQFFDVNGHLYISNNSNGYIYKVTNLDSEPSVSGIFAYGPSSTSNDGARCALAGVPVGDAVDFGDAPDSYGSNITNNGARHAIVSGIQLGALIDNEGDAYASPLSDDASDNSDDEDGISMPTGFESGEETILIADVVGDEGYLNAWIDWNQDGVFGPDEQIIASELMNEGDNNITIQVPFWAEAGDTWARFRLSTTQDLGATGGASDGEVEDYPITITETGVTTGYYPVGTEGVATIVYEDLYPLEGDYDFNDVVMEVKINEFEKEGKIRRVKIEVKVLAVGATFHNGFGIQLPGILRSAIKESGIRWDLDGVNQSHKILEEGQTNAVFIITEDVHSYTTVPPGCEFLGTQVGCTQTVHPTWTITIPFETPIDRNHMPELPYDPFIFANPNTPHGALPEAVLGEIPGRALEVHLKNKVPTDKFDTRLFGTGDDASKPNEGLYFQNANGMPWALIIPKRWSYPVEKIPLNEAYPDFESYATGAGSLDWYQNGNPGLTIPNE